METNVSTEREKLADGIPEWNWLGIDADRHRAMVFERLLHSLDVLRLDVDNRLWLHCRRCMHRVRHAVCFAEVVNACMHADHIHVCVTMVVNHDKGHVYAQGVCEEGCERGGSRKTGAPASRDKAGGHRSSSTTRECITQLAHADFNLVWIS